MAWCASRSLSAPAVDLGALRTRAPVVAGVSFISLASSKLWSSSPPSLSRSKPFACLNASMALSAAAGRAVITLIVPIMGWFAIVASSLSDSLGVVVLYGKASLLLSPTL